VVVQSCYGDASCTITSANDGQHSEKSLHYSGNALDFRTKDYLGDKMALVDSIRTALGPDFDVVLEDEGLPNEHVHLEYQP
jgi:conjugal transfer mating pair stabilization protein TraG